MNNEKYNQIIDEAYENYKHYFENKYGNYITGRITKEDGDYLIVNKHPLPQETILSIIYSKEEFIDKCKTDSEFSERWGLKIEERELSLDERLYLVNYDKNRFNSIDEWINWYNNEPNEFYYMGINYTKETALTDLGVPTKLITITYNNQIIEIYE